MERKTVDGIDVIVDPDAPPGTAIVSKVTGTVTVSPQDSHDDAIREIVAYVNSGLYRVA